MKLGKAIRMLRLYHGMRQREVCAKTDISTSHMSEMERDAKRPTVDGMYRIAEVYGLPGSALIHLAEVLDLPEGSEIPDFPHPRMKLIMTMHEAQTSLRK